VAWHEYRFHSRQAADWRCILRDEHITYVWFEAPFYPASIFAPSSNWEKEEMILYSKVEVGISKVRMAGKRERFWWSFWG